MRRGPYAAACKQPERLFLEASPTPVPGAAGSDSGEGCAFRSNLLLGVLAVRNVKGRDVTLCVNRGTER